MRVVKMKDIIHVLELHLETSEAAGIVLDLLDYQFDTNDDAFNNFEEKLRNGCSRCEAKGWCRDADSEVARWCNNYNKGMQTDVPQTTSTPYCIDTSSVCKVDISQTDCGWK